jgi:hypothetical protein
MGANTRQVAGNHYVKYGEFQVWDAWWHWNLDAFQANIIKYVMRTKGTVAHRLEDLAKAEHYLQKYKELLTAKLENQEKQFNEANATSWTLTPIQAAIVKSISQGDITAKLQELQYVEQKIAEYKQQLTDMIV